MPAPRKISDADVLKIRRRVQGGEQLSALAKEFGVNRKTVRRRLDLLERAERRKAERIANTRLRRQAAGELRTLEKRERQIAPDPVRPPAGAHRRRSTKRDAYYDWLDTPKNLGPRASAEASGLVKIRTLDGKQRIWVERADLDKRLNDGWFLD